MTTDSTADVATRPARSTLNWVRRSGSTASGYSVKSMTLRRIFGVPTAGARSRITFSARATLARMPPKVNISIQLTWSAFLRPSGAVAGKAHVASRSTMNAMRSRLALFKSCRRSAS